MPPPMGRKGQGGGGPGRGRPRFPLPGEKSPLGAPAEPGGWAHGAEAVARSPGFFPAPALWAASGRASAESSIFPPEGPRGSSPVRSGTAPRRRLFPRQAGRAFPPPRCPRLPRRGSGALMKISFPRGFSHGPRSRLLSPRFCHYNTSLPRCKRGAAPLMLCRMRGRGAAGAWGPGRSPSQRAAM